MEESTEAPGQKAAGAVPLPGQPPREWESPWISVALLAALGLLLLSVRQILPPFVVGASLAYVFSPVVSQIERLARLPRLVAVLAFLIVLLGPLAILGWLLEPTLVQETKALFSNSPAILNNLLVQLFGGKSLSIAGQVVDADTVASYLLEATLDFLGTPSQAIHVAAVAVEAALDGFLSVVLLFYFLLDPKRFAQAAVRLLPPQHRAAAQEVGREIHSVLSRYIRGLLFLVALMTAATWLGLTLLFRLPYALPIAIATGFLEIIPFLGPVVAAGIASVVALSYGGTSLALAVALFYLVLRQIEDQLVMPVVIGRAVEIYPAVAIFAVLAGGALGGVLGALLGIPVAAALKVAFERWRPI